MPPALWLLEKHRPIIRVTLPLHIRGPNSERNLIADTGAGDRRSSFQLILAELDCLDAGGVLMGQVKLGGAYTGYFSIYAIQVRIPLLGFDEPVPVAGVTSVPAGFDGIAGFMFLNRFHTGNFDAPDRFGLDLFSVP